MAVIVQKARLGVSATMEFNEVELRALDALVGYGIEGFLPVFYEKMGSHYLRPHEAGLRLIFETVRQIVPGILSRTDDAARVFSGERIATHRPKFPSSGVYGNDEGIAKAFKKEKAP
jgi:hypothetical protein